MRDDRWRRPTVSAMATALAVALLCCCIAVHLRWVFTALRSPLLTEHDFRQAQTAIAAYWMGQGSPFLRYWTPVMGAPWSIPFEFPLYQGICALLWRLCGGSLLVVCRLVSWGFFLALLPVLSSLLCRMGIRGRQQLYAFSLVLLSPLYMYWSATAMMESAGLFFGALFLDQLLAVLSGGRVPPMLICGVAGALAAAIKITTFLGFCWLASLAWLVHAFRAARSVHRIGTPQPAGRRPLVASAAAVATSLAAGLAWTRFADAQKGKNPLAAGFITSDALGKWNFGTWAQRKQLASWDFLFHRIPADTLGLTSARQGAVCVAMLLAGLLLRGPRRWLPLWVASPFVLLPTVFFNLYFVHSYYAYASGIYLLGAVALALAGLDAQGGWRRLVAGGLALYFATLQYAAVPDRQWRVAETPLHRTAQWIDGHTPPDSVLVIYGLDWSSVLPLYAHRRALMDRWGLGPTDPRMQVERAELARAQLTVGAMVFCGRRSNQPGFVRGRLRDFGFDPQISPQYAADCTVYLSPNGS